MARNTVVAATNRREGAIKVVRIKRKPGCKNILFNELAQPLAVHTTIRAECGVASDQALEVKLTLAVAADVNTPGFEMQIHPEKL